MSRATHTASRNGSPSKACIAAARAVAGRPDGPSTEAVRCADEIICALFQTPFHRADTLRALADPRFSADWWPTDTHRRIAAAVAALESQGAKVTPGAVVRVTEGVIDAVIMRSIISTATCADSLARRFRVLQDDHGRRTWARQRDAIRLACELRASRQEIGILFADSAEAAS